MIIKSTLGQLLALGRELPAEIVEASSEKASEDSNPEAQTEQNGGNHEDEG